MPLEQDMRRDASTWGHLFEFHVIAGNMTSLGLGFAMHVEGKGDNWQPSMFSLSMFVLFSTCFLASAPASPVKSVLKSVSLPLVMLNADSVYAASRSYDDPGELLALSSSE